MVGHLWSLGVQEQFYLLLTQRFEDVLSPRVAVLWTAVALGPIFSALCYYFKVPGRDYTYFPATAGNLVIGCLLAFYNLRIPRISLWIAIVMRSRDSDSLTPREYFAENHVGALRPLADHELLHSQHTGCCMAWRWHVFPTTILNSRF